MAVTEFKGASLALQTRRLVEESAAVSRRARTYIRQAHAIVVQSMELLRQDAIRGGTGGVQRQARAPEHFAECRTAASSAEAGPSLERVAERNFSDETVRLDGRHFVDCRVENCVLEYGGGPVVLEGTHFSGCRFRFGGEAAMTVSMLECFGMMEAQEAELALSGGSHAGHGRVN